MKKSILLLISFSFLVFAPLHSQSRFLKNVARDVKSDVFGTPGGNTQSTQPEPACACDPAELIFDLGSQKLMYTEVGIDVMNDGSVLVQDRISGKYYIIREGINKGPYDAGNPLVSPYLSGEGSDEENPLMKIYKEYITKSGDKYQIKFNGKVYGPYAEIKDFGVTKSKDKFAATVVENVVVTQDQGKKMDEAMKKAKTDQEKMELAMKFQQEMMQNMMAGGGPSSSLPKVVSNIEGVTFNPSMGGTISAKMKYDDILVNKFQTISDLKDKTIITIKPEHSMTEEIFLNTSNTRYAAYTSGTIYFNDGKSLSELFNPYLIKTGGTVYLTYMYYSPGKNAIMQCRIPF